MARSPRSPRSSSFAVCIALVLGSLLVAPSAEAATKRSITVSANPAAALAGSKVTISGAVSKTPKGANVKIQRKAGKKWKTVTTVKTKSAGKYSGKVTLKSTPGYYKYRAVATAFEGLKKATSKSVTVAALRKTTFFKVGGGSTDVVYLSATDGEPSNAVGRLNKPFTAGASATLQRKSGSTWTKVGASSVDSTGLFQIGFTAMTGTYRVVIGRKGLNASATSVARLITFDKA